MGKHIYFSREIVEAPFNPQPFSHVELSASSYTVAWTMPVYHPQTNKLIYSPRCFDPSEYGAFNVPYNYFVILNLDNNTISHLNITETPPNAYGWRLAKGGLHRNGKIYYPMATGIDMWVVLDPGTLTYEMLTTFQISNGLVASPTISDNSQMVSIGVSSMLGEVFFAPCGSAFSKIMKINLAGKLENVVDVPNNRKYYDGGMLKDGSIIFKEYSMETSKILRLIPSTGAVSELSYDVRSNSFASWGSNHALLYPTCVCSTTTNVFSFGKNGDGQYIEVCNPEQKVSISNSIWTTTSDCSGCHAMAPNDLFVEFPGYTSLNNYKYCEYDLSLGLGGTCYNPGTGKYGSYRVGLYIGNLQLIPGKMVFFECAAYTFKFLIYTYTELY